MATRTMIKSSDLLKRYNLHHGPQRLRVVDSETKTYEIVYEGSDEFERLMLSLYLLDKYMPNERQLCFETRTINAVESIVEDAERLFHFLTDKKLSIKVEASKQGGIAKQDRLFSDNQLSDDRGSPCLFSGGLDSAAGAIVLMKNNRDPILSHTATGNIALGKASRLRSQSSLRHLPLIITDMRTEGADFVTGKTRGLIFLSNALVLASSLGRDHLFLPENGPLMINPHVSLQAEPTKNAHPYLINTLEKIFKRTTQFQVRIDPIFKDMTKAEVAAKVLNEGIIDISWSCFNVQGQSKMCGMCFACFVRRLSLLALDHEEPPGTYELDPFAVDRSLLTGTRVKNLDILHDSFLFLERSLLDETVITNELLNVPNGFFSDPIGLLKRFSLDMFLGLQKYISKAKHLGTLGNFAIKILRKIPPDYLRQREEELRLQNA